MIRNKLMVALGLAALVTPALAAAQNEGLGQGQAVITILPARGSEAAAAIGAQDLSVKIGGKEATIANWMPLRGPNDRVELVVLIDAGVHTSMSTQMGTIESFVKRLPPDTKAAIAYMDSGAARFTGPFSTDRDQVLKGLHIPSGFAGQNGSPYFCLSDLAKKWPSEDHGARRIVVMIGDGVDSYYARYDPDDPYVQAAIEDSLRAGLVVYSMYWEDKGRIDESAWGNYAGHNLLAEVAEATGGYDYWQGSGNPVSFEPFFNDLDRRLQNQYELGFTVPAKHHGEVEPLKLKVNGISGKVDAPTEVWVRR